MSNLHSHRPINRRVSAVACCFFLVLTACSSAKPRAVNELSPLYTEPGRPVESLTQKLLRSLPEPKGKITAAVYGFSDLTGQNKPSPASGLSSAVTQGAAHILIKSLLESGWFSPLERNGLQNVLTERNLWNQHLAGQAELNKRLGAMPPASIIFEGGIVAYDFNLRTGGNGAKILGIGGSQQYREDTLTINLRAINGQDGRILESVNSTKSIFSKSVNTGLFGYVEYDSLLELENGYAYNESVQLGVEAAIQSGLVDIILQGILNKRWSLKNEADLWHPAFQSLLSQDEAQLNVTKQKGDKVEEEPSPKELVSEVGNKVSGNNVLIPSPSRGAYGRVNDNGNLDSPSLNSTAKLSSLKADSILNDNDQRVTSRPIPITPAKNKLNSEKKVENKAINIEGHSNIATAEKGSQNTTAQALASFKIENTNEIAEAKLEESVSESIEGSSVSSGTKPLPVEGAVSKSDQLADSVKRVSKKEVPSISEPSKVVRGIMIHIVLDSGIEHAKATHKAVDQYIDGVDVILLTSSNEPNIYRVRVGEIETPENAELVLGALRKMGFKNLEVEQVFE